MARSGRASSTSYEARPWVTPAKGAIIRVTAKEDGAEDVKTSQVGERRIVGHENTELEPHKNTRAPAALPAEEDLRGERALDWDPAVGGLLLSEKQEQQRSMPRSKLSRWGPGETGARAKEARATKKMAGKAKQKREKRSQRRTGRL